MNLKNIMLSERRLTKGHIITLFEMSRTDKFIETESRLVVVRGCGERGMGSDSLTGTIFLFGVLKMFWN